MKKILFSSEQISALKEALKGEQVAKIARRIQAIYWKSQGKSHTEIADLLLVTKDTLTDWVVLYDTAGLFGLQNLQYEGRRLSKLNGLQDAMKKHMEQAAVPTLKYLADWLKKNHNIIVEESWLSRFCKKNSIGLSRKHG